MEKCFALTVFLALSLRATAGRHYNDGYDFHHHFEVNPETWHEPYPHHHKHGPHPHKPHEAKHAHGEEFRGQPDSWESQSGSSESHSGSWEYPNFPHHGNHDHPNNFHHHGVDSWYDEHHGRQLPHYYPGHESHQWNHGGNNQLGGWNHGVPSWNQERPNTNQVGSSWNQGEPCWHQVGTNLDPVLKPSSQPDRQNQPGRPGSNRPGLGWYPARPGGWGQPSSTTTVTPGPATQAPLAIALCIRSCPVTSEYNPVCGSNNVTYGNPGRLECAKYCGVDVSLQRKQACTAGTQNVTQVTNLPPLKPTRFTTIDVPTSTQRPTEPNLDTTKFTISQDILNNIFTTQSTTVEDSTVDDNYDIDIRSRNTF